MGKERRLSDLSEVPGDVPKFSATASPEYVNIGRSWAPAELPAYPDSSSPAISSKTFFGGSPRIGGIDYLYLDLHTVTGLTTS